MLGYREDYMAEGHRRPPHAILAVAVICAETMAEAQRVAAPMRLAWVRLRAGRLGKLPTPEEAEAHVFTADELPLVAMYEALQIVGDPLTVKAHIESLAASTRADEVMVSTVTADPVTRTRSYELVAAAFGLGVRG